MKLIQQTHESEPYLVKADYTVEAKATYFDLKDELLNDKQTQFLSYCVANNYQHLYDFKKDPVVKTFLETLTEEQEEKLHQQLIIYNYGSYLMLPKTLTISHGINTFEAQPNKEDIKSLLFDAVTNFYTFNELDDFEDHLPYEPYSDYSEIGMIEYLVNDRTKTYQFIKDGYFIKEKFYNVVKGILQNENVTLIKRIDNNNDNHILTIISNNNQTVTINFKQ